MKPASLPDWATKDPDINRLLKKLDFDEADAVRVSQEQPRLFYEASRYHADAKRARLSAKTRLGVIAAELTLEIRQDMMNAGERPQAGIVKAKVLTHKRYKEALEGHERAIEKEDTAKMLVEAYRQRKDAIRAIIDQNRAEFGANRGPSSFDRDELRRKLQAKYPAMES